MDKVQGQLCAGFKRKMWSDEATVTSEQTTFYLGDRSSSAPAHRKLRKCPRRSEKKKKKKKPTDNAVMLETLAARASEHVKLI